MLNGVLAWECAIPHKHSDMVNSKAAKGSRFFWTGYLVNLDNHISPSRAISVCGKGGCHPRPVAGPTRCVCPGPVCGSAFRWPGRPVVGCGLLQGVRPKACCRRESARSAECAAGAI